MFAEIFASIYFIGGFRRLQFEIPVTYVAVKRTRSDEGIRTKVTTSWGIKNDRFNQNFIESFTWLMPIGIQVIPSCKIAIKIKSSSAKICVP